MKKVLIALDYGPTAQRVAEEGYAMAKAMDAKLVLLHVVADMASYSSLAFSPVMGFGGYADLNFMEPEISDDIKKASQEFLDATKEHLKDDSIEVLIKEGDTADEIAAAAKEVAADVIVMGTHSRKWLETIVMGSVTEKVMHHITIPLYLVPTKK
ncbi:universal stress protein [Ferruginibacter sp.]